MNSGLRIYSASEKVDISVFGTEFSVFSSSATRLELLPVYRVPEEERAILAFRSGEPVDRSFNEGWHRILSSAAARNAAVKRLRAIPPTPTEYLKFETEHGYIPSQSFGEEVRFIEIEKVSSRFGETPLLDFWVFDRARFYLMIYDTRGVFLGVLKLRVDLGDELLGYVDDLWEDAHGLDWARECFTDHT